MENKIRTAAIAAALAVQPLIALAAGTASESQTLSDFIEQRWKVPSFEPGRDTMASTVPLRVSTYSSPPFIHQAQLENLGAKARDLAEFCRQQGGEWGYLGLATTETPSRGRTGQTNPAVAEAVERAPVTEAGMRSVVAMGEQAVKDDVARELVRAMLQQPDALVADALEHATRMKWLGRFECRGPSSSWAAAISFSKWANRGERSMSYKDITLKIAFSERP